MMSQAAYTNQAHAAQGPGFFNAIEVTVVEARHLEGEDGLLRRKSDPYVIVHAGMTHKLKTAVKEKTVNPVWNEKFVLTKGTFSNEITVEIFDSDRFRDDYLGKIEIKVDDIARNRGLDMWFPLTNKKGKKVAKGEIHLILHPVLRM
ncbi:Extended synaptotagmin-3 [Blastocladiella emersonii ATCC 22665]|nr:Extended synaptotagmin-3 [Blastocladiella emersonii ATCC 22665]